MKHRADWERFVPAAILLPLTFAVQATLQLPLRVTELQPSFSEGVVRFNVVNDSERPISAWSLWIRTKLENGTFIVDGIIEDSLVGMERDNPVSGSPNPNHRFGLLYPGDAHQYSIAIDERTAASPRNVEIEMRSAVFADGSYEGDSEDIQEVFEGRKARQLVQEHWAQVIEHILSSTPSEYELKTRLLSVISNLEGHTDRYGDDEISAEHPIARHHEGILADQLRQVLNYPHGTRSLFRRADDFLQTMIRRYEYMRERGGYWRNAEPRKRIN